MDFELKLRVKIRIYCCHVGWHQMVLSVSVVGAIYTYIHIRIYSFKSFCNSAKIFCLKRENLWWLCIKFSTKWCDDAANESRNSNHLTKLLGLWECFRMLFKINKIIKCAKIAKSTPHSGARGPCSKYHSEKIKIKYDSNDILLQITFMLNIILFNNNLRYSTLLSIRLANAKLVNNANNISFAWKTIDKFQPNADKFHFNK